MSGMDLPIKTQNQIHEFFDSYDCEFVDISSAELPYHRRYTQAVYPLLKLIRYRQSKILRCISEAFARLQLAVGYNYQKKHNTNNWKYADGWTWWSITDDMARYVIEKEPEVYNVFKNAKAPDEFFVPTLAYNSGFAEKIYSHENHEKATMRMIDWKRGKPYTYRSEDFDELIQSPYMFARKFDEQVDYRIIDMITSVLK